MSSQTETWCDICQYDERISYHHACGLPGNDGDKWPNAYGPMDISSLVWDHGWVTFVCKRQVPERVYTRPDGQDDLVFESYETTEELMVCAHCLRDEDELPVTPADCGSWVLTPGVHHNQENFNKAKAERGAAHDDQATS